jgi:antitoxin component of MazEF toxin-antitoxin module
MGDMKLEVVLGEGGNSLRMTIPQPIVKLMGLKKGDKLELDVVNGELHANKKEGKQ